MQELVGQCEQCKKDIFCKDGFLQGLILDDGKLVCLDCSNREEKERL
ncbi:hypothetical protein SAMN05428962_4173 [Paenibacillus sp. BC26]|nr:hypothetical protein SAMN05428962_4173 [Paenibacillus sp. BC26]